jgi:hypothetical protein
MRTSMRFATSIICAAGAAACHHNARVSDPNDVAYRPDTTTSVMSSSTSSSSAASSDAAPSVGYADSTSSATRTSSTSDMTRGRSARGGMRGERSEIYRAIRTLDGAKYSLEHASHEYGGHRTSALKAVDVALSELHTASAQEARPHTARNERVEAKELRQAVTELERARHDMETAKHDFGGRKTETLRAVDAALSELRVAAENEK